MIGAIELDLLLAVSLVACGDCTANNRSSSHEEARSVDLRRQGVSTQATLFLNRLRGSLVKLLDNEEWVEEQFGACQFGNTLRTKRLKKIAANMLAQPEKSLPQQNPEWADLKAAYRLFDNDQVTFDAVAEQHWEQTRETASGRYLLISDTTDIDHFSHGATTGLGQLGKGDGRGMQLHSSLVYSCGQAQIEGVAGALIDYRRNGRKNETRTQCLHRVRESELWGNLV